MNDELKQSGLSGLTAGLFPESMPEGSPEHGIAPNETGKLPVSHGFSFPRSCELRYSTVTDLARLRGWSTSQPRRTAM